MIVECTHGDSFAEERWQVWLPARDSALLGWPAFFRIPARLVGNITRERLTRYADPLYSEIKNDFLCSNLYVYVLLLSLLHHAGVFLEQSSESKL
jgi:hypothetical protein